jgi:hypothetical protein
VSRYGRDIGHGFGFRPIFRGLANMKGVLRFRSGDHSLVLDGTTPSLTTAKPAQKTTLAGFMVSITCEADRLVRQSSGQIVARPSSPIERPRGCVP